MPAPRDVILGTEEPAQGRTESEHWEVASAHQLGENALDPAAEIVGHRRELGGGDAGEDLPALPLEVLVVRIREGREREIVIGEMDFHQPLGLGQWWPPEEDGVHQAEGGGIRTDAQGQRKQGDQGEARRLAKAAGRVAEISECGVHRTLSEASSTAQSVRTSGREVSDVGTLSLTGPVPTITLESGIRLLWMRMAP